MREDASISINEIQEQIIREMARLDDWMEKYEYLIDLGRDLPPMETALRRDEYSIAGCQSQVWLMPRMRDGRMNYVADSDAKITRGIIALVLRVLNNQPPRDIAAAELYFLDRTGLRSNLSPSRANGLAAIVKQMKAAAAARMNT
ncbi:MAG: SufE family protein [Candidatus Omnitrophica bacterium]|nr:SufE family protein [Candidatus Omnitrophota bacterium]